MPGKKLTDEDFVLAAAALKVVCPVCSSSATLPCRVTAGPYAGTDTSFHEARLSAARGQLATQQEGTTS